MAGFGRSRRGPGREACGRGGESPPPPARGRPGDVWASQAGFDDARAPPATRPEGRPRALDPRRRPGDRPSLRGVVVVRRARSAAPGREGSSRSRPRAWPPGPLGDPRKRPQAGPPTRHSHPRGRRAGPPRGSYAVRPIDASPPRSARLTTALPRRSPATSRGLPPRREIARIRRNRGPESPRMRPTRRRAARPLDPGRPGISTNICNIF